MLDALGLCQSIEATRICRNRSIVDVGLLVDEAAEESFLEQVFVRAALGVVHGIERVRIGQNIAALWVVQPEKRFEFRAIIR